MAKKQTNLIFMASESMSQVAHAIKLSRWRGQKCRYLQGDGPEM